MPNLLRLGSIRQHYGITLDQLAGEAGLEKRVIYLAGIGGAISEGEAEQILQALTRITGERFTKSMVPMNIKNLLPSEAVQQTKR
jgi:hypothetical protein